MTAGSVLNVVVEEVGPRAFAWTLMMKQSSSGLGESVAMASNPFPDYDQALDAGFAALYAFRIEPSTSKASATGT